MTELFRLVCNDRALALTLPMDDQAVELLLRRIQSVEGAAVEQAALAKQIAAAITGAFAITSAPPSTKQLKYAEAICRELGIAMPDSCRTQQEAAREFITRHAPEYNRRRSLRQGQT